VNNIKEDEGAVPANVTGDSSNMAMPPTSGGLMRRKYKSFDVDSQLFRKFETGKVKFEHWSKYLDMQNESHSSIYEYAKKNPTHVIVLRNSDNGALRAIRRRSSNGS
jgi:hypothetical protein